MFADRIKEQRNRLELTQVELADKIGVTQQAVGKWESGKGTPTLNTINRLANLFNVTTDYLLGRTNESYYLLPSDSPEDKASRKTKQDAEVSSVKEIGIYDKNNISDQTLEKLMVILDQIKRELARD